MTVEELSKEKTDLEAALKDVLQALKISQDSPSEAALLQVPALEKLAKVSESVTGWTIVVQLLGLL